MKHIAYDPNATGVYNGNYFGLPFTVEESALALLSVPWDVTASYGKGASSAPDAIIEASTQLDLYDRFAPQAWERGVGTIAIDYSIQETSDKLNVDSKKVIEHLEAGESIDEGRIKHRIERINNTCAELNESVYRQSVELLAAGKLAGLVGGDHSTPYGLIRAVAEHEGSVGVLHLDAHRDLRRSYQGFTWSHASIMRNVIDNIENVSVLVQVGVRDFSHAEQEFATSHPRIVSFEDSLLAQNEFTGTTWDRQCEEIVAALPEKVYVSFDIDALSPENCPGTGTPVPGGLGFNRAAWLLERVVLSGRRIAGFDLCEVCPSANNDWNANAGARMLFKLCTLTLAK
jgi:agmatinase